MSQITEAIHQQLVNFYFKVFPGSTKRQLEELADAWWKEEDAGEYRAGCCHHDYRPAAVAAIEAVRSLNTGVDGKKDAVRLLKLALEELR